MLELGLVVAVLAILLLMLGVLSCVDRLNHAEQREKTLKHELELVQAYTDNARQRALAASNLLNDAKAQAQQVVLAAKQEAERFKTSNLKDTSLQAMDAILRDSQVLFVRYGQLLTVRVLVVPETGRVGLEWKVRWEWPTPPRVHILLDDITQDVEHAYCGMWVRTLLRGKSYRFCLTVYRDRNQADELTMTVQVPTARQWKRSVGALPRELAHEDLSAQKQQELRRLAESFIAEQIDKSRLIEETRAKLRAASFDEERQVDVLAALEAWLAKRNDSDQ